ncbi:MAG TPA: OprD family outer membrane porin [Povalibacter sp.]|uniref:OprD family outer membrane porin n=1 Tax=Povalibacter sp. TaxID=1962978 RepID=UPI002D149A7A|nr:OprD family outer membrane porin [Povalibacter sp.]HMN45870.1 OprD family outer membrane porin [Povalibacter sp.]
MSAKRIDARTAQRRCPSGAMWLGGLLLSSMAAAQQSTPAVPDAERRDEEPNQQNQINVVRVDEELRGFWEGTSLAIKPRSYYLDRDRDTNPDNAGWSLGGALAYRSGWWLSRIAIGATLFTSQKLYGPEDKDGTQLFKPGQESFTVLGEAFVTARIGEDTGFRLGRQSFDLPFVNKHDIRMVQNTFEAVALGRPSKTGWSYIAAYVDEMKRKNDDEFIPMSEAAGAAGTDEGLALAAAQYTFGDGGLIGATYQRAFEVMDTFFIKAEKSFQLGSDVSLRGYAQYTDQRSKGDALIGDFSTNLTAVMAELFIPNASFRLAASTAGSERGIQSPFGGPPNYLSIIVENFDRASEDAWMVGASYDFKGTALDGLSLFANVATGKTPDSGPTATPDEREYDLTVDYKFAKESVLKGLAIRLRGAWIDQEESEGGDDFFDFRVIVNYAFDAL